MAVEELRKRQEELDRNKYMLEQQNRGLLKENMTQQVH
jgi:hypothetical protein